MMAQVPSLPLAKLLNMGGTRKKSNAIPHQHKIIPTIPTSNPIVEEERGL